MNEPTVGQTDRWARKRAGMTQHDLAQATRMPQPSIARIESGAVVPRASTLIQILHATGHQLSVEPIGTPKDAESAAVLGTIVGE
jgi:predicted transcriptional regulator